MKKNFFVLLLVAVVLSLVSCDVNKNVISDNDKDGEEIICMQNAEMTCEQSDELLRKGELLPIGSIVLLKNSNRKIMIIGVLQFDSSNKSVVYDYSGVLYPDGLIDPKNNYLFNASQIERIYFLGYHNEEQDIFEDKVKQVREKYSNTIQ